MADKKELNSTMVKAIAHTVMEKFGKEDWDDVVFFSTQFMNLPNQYQLRWLDGLERKWKSKLPKEGQHPNLYEIGKHYVAWCHYMNLYEKNTIEKANTEPLNE